MFTALPLPSPLPHEKSTEAIGAYRAGGRMSGRPAALRAGRLGFGRVVVISFALLPRRARVSFGPRLGVLPTASGCIIPRRPFARLVVLTAARDELAGHHRVPLGEAHDA
jgi:hypothetical protein